MDTNSVRNVSTFQNAIHARRTSDGRTVRLLAIGDQEGKSPVYLAVDEHGESQWSALRDFRIIDANALPVKDEAFETGTTAGSASRR